MQQMNKFNQHYISYSVNQCRAIKAESRIKTNRTLKVIQF